MAKRKTDKQAVSSSAKGSTSRVSARNKNRNAHVKGSTSKSKGSSKATGNVKETEEMVEIIDEEEPLSEVGQMGHTPKQKPALADEMVVYLAKRKAIKAHSPKFRRQEWFRYKKLGDSWRKPRGLHSKTRTHRGRRPKVVRIGFGGPRQARHLHPSGFQEVLVYNSHDLDSVDPKIQAIRIGGTVGTKKRIQIQSRADELGIRILNRVV